MRLYFADCPQMGRGVPVLCLSSGTSGYRQALGPASVVHVQVAMLPVSYQPAAYLAQTL